MSIKQNTASLQEVLEIINGLPESGGVQLPTLNNPGTASDLLSGKQMINQYGSPVTGNIPTRTDSNLTVSGATVSVPSGYYASATSKSVTTATQATPTISVNSSTGLITASATQSEGYVSAGTKSSTNQLTTQAAQTITPGTTAKYIESGRYLTGRQTISAIQTETKSITTNGTYTPSNGKYFSSVTVNVPSSGITPSGTINITTNGTHNVTNYASAVVNVPSTNIPVVEQATPSITVSTNGLITASATQQAGQVAAGTKTATKQLTTRTASNLTASGATVTVPAGYYASQATKSVATATQATPSISVSASGLITASATQSEGYVSAGTKSATNQLTTQGAQTITPGTSNKTIASGKYLTGTQTIQGDSNLKAENIKEGVSIFNVTGTFKGGMSANFEIVRYDNENQLLAASPSNNTIGVATTTPISSWVFSTSAPSSPSSNMLWIETGKQGTVELNLVTTNGIIVYPLNAKQYINGAWVKVSAYNRQNNSWVSWIHDLIYFDNGRTDLTDSLTYKSVTVNANGYLNFSLGTSGNAYANTPIINLSGMQLVELDYSNLSGSSTFAGGMYIRILDVDGSTVIKNTTRSTSTAKTLTLDVSDLDGEYIVQAYGSNSSGSYSGSARVKTLKVLTSASAASVAEAKAAAYDILVGDN